MSLEAQPISRSTGQGMAEVVDSRAGNGHAFGSTTVNLLAIGCYAKPRWRRWQLRRSRCPFMDGPIAAKRAAWRRGHFKEKVGTGRLSERATEDSSVAASPMGRMTNRHGSLSA